MVVYVDGDPVFDSEKVEPIRDPAGYTFGYFLFEASIKASGSNVSLVAAKMGRWTDVGFGLYSTSHDLNAHTLIPEGMSLDQRQALEDTIENVEIEREFYYDGDELAVITGAHNGVELSAVVSSWPEKQFPLAAGRNILCQADELPEGPFSLEIYASSAGGFSVSTGYEMYKMVSTLQISGIKNFEKRKKNFIEHLIRVKDLGGHGNSESYLMAAYYYFKRYNEITMDLVKEICDYIRERKDCSDFRIQAVLRILYWERNERHLNDEIINYMKETCNR
jgi:hypothetical protein